MFGLNEHNNIAKEHMELEFRCFALNQILIIKTR